MGEGEKEPSLARKLVTVAILDLSLDLVKVTTCRYAVANSRHVYPCWRVREAVALKVGR